MIIAIQVAVNPSEPGWESKLAAAAKAVWTATQTNSKAFIAFSEEASSKLIPVATDLEVSIKTVTH